jgi:hypothetical protein
LLLDCCVYLTLPGWRLVAVPAFDYIINKGSTTMFDSW